MNKDLSALVRELRTLRGGQEALAACAGLDAAHISRILKGQRVPSIEVATRIAGALKVSLREFVDWFGTVRRARGLPWYTDSAPVPWRELRLAQAAIKERRPVKRRVKVKAHNS
jgi:transcriptional regulator with XRE-family HTH domain